MVVTDYNEQFLDKRGTDHLIEELKAYADGIATGDIDLSDYVTKSELQAELDTLDINIDLSSYATKEELTDAINSIDLSAYALKTEIPTVPSLDGYATTEYVDNAIANVPSGGGNVDLSNYYTKEETDALIPSTEGLATEEYVDNAVSNIPTTDLTGYATEEYVSTAINSIPATDLSNYYTKDETYSKTEVDTLVANSGGSSSGETTTDLTNYYTKDEVDERDLMISPFACLGEKYITDNMPNIKAYAGTNTITFEAGIDVYGGILVDGGEPYYFNDYSEIDSSKNSFTFEADSEVIVKDYVFYFGESTDGLSNVTVTITNGSKSDAYSIPIYGDGMQEVYYRKIKYTPLYRKRTKLDFAKSSFSPLNSQVYKNRDEITRLKESGISGADGTTPHIDSTTKHWMIGDTDTGVIAEGSDGVSPTVTVTKSGKVATITCTDKNGTTTATISDGADGSSSGSGGSSGGGITYAFDTEIATGDTWVDGRPIYMKVIDFTGVTPSSVSGYNLRMIRYDGWLINEVIDSKIALRDGITNYASSQISAKISGTNLTTVVNDINSKIVTRNIHYTIISADTYTTIQVFTGTIYSNATQKIYFTVKYTKP